MPMPRKRDLPRGQVWPKALHRSYPPSAMSLHGPVHSPQDGLPEPLDAFFSFAEPDSPPNLCLASAMARLHQYDLRPTVPSSCDLQHTLPNGRHFDLPWNQRDRHVLHRLPVEHVYRVFRRLVPAHNQSVRSIASAG